MKKEVNKTITTTNTSYSIPTSFVGTPYPWVHVKDVGMEYDVFVVVVVLFTSFFIICTPAIPTSPFISKKCFFYLFHQLFCAPGCGRCNTVTLAKLVLLKGKTQSTRPTVPMQIAERHRASESGRPLRHWKVELTKWRRTTFTCGNVCRFTGFCRVDKEKFAWCRCTPLPTMDQFY